MLVGSALCCPSLSLSACTQGRRERVGGWPHSFEGNGPKNWSRRDSEGAFRNPFQHRLLLLLLLLLLLVVVVVVVVVVVILVVVLSYLVWVGVKINRSCLMA